MTILGGQFEWDDAKEATNLAKHGVSFLEAVEAFADPGASSSPTRPTAGTNHAGIALAALAETS